LAVSLPAQTSEAERIGVNQVAKILPSGKCTGSDQREHTSHVPTARRPMFLFSSFWCCSVDVLIIYLISYF